jgi:hypothetical protein
MYFLVAPTIAWDFQNTLNDRSGVYNGTGYNNPTYGLGRSNCSKCLNLSMLQNQSVIVSTPYIDLRPISFSFEAWIKPVTIINPAEQVIISQCGALNTRQCMRSSIVASGTLGLLFRSDNGIGNHIIPRDVWSHVAFVYNSSASTMSMYFNGTLDASGSGHGPFAGPATYFQIGNVDGYGGLYFFGCIDELFFYSFARTASEISATYALG